MSKLGDEYKILLNSLPELEDREYDRLLEILQLAEEDDNLLQEVEQIELEAVEEEAEPESTEEDIERSLEIMLKVAGAIRLLDAVFAQDK